MFGGRVGPVWCLLLSGDQGQQHGVAAPKGADGEETGLGRVSPRVAQSKTASAPVPGARGEGAGEPQVAASTGHSVPLPRAVASF